MSKKAICICCGKEYELCPHCPTFIAYTPWRRMHCSIEHFKVFETAREYKNGTLSKESARERLSRIGITGYENWSTQTGEVIEEIYGTFSPPCA